MSSETPRPFNPNSPDAMFATILERMSAQDDKLGEILRHVEKTNGRVTKLEHWRTTIKAKLGLASGAVSAVVAALAWCAEKLFG